MTVISTHRILCLATVLVLACGGCGSGSGSTQLTSPPGGSSTTGVIRGPQTVSGTASAQDAAKRSIHLRRGEALRAVVTADSLMTVAILISGDPISGDPNTPSSDVASYDHAWRALGGGGMVYEQTAYYITAKNVYSNTNLSLPDIGGTALISSITLRGGCVEGSGQWLVFVAPSDGTYNLVVLSVAGSTGNPENGTFKATFEAEAPLGIDASGFANQGLAAWYPASVLAHRRFLTDPSFFNANLFTFGARGGPYEQSGCGQQDYKMYGPVGDNVGGVLR